MAKQKIKTKKTLKKRVKVTKNGKLMRKLVGMAHLKATKSVDRKLRKGKITQQLDRGNRKMFIKLLAGRTGRR